jgi:hypothetical protein
VSKARGAPYETEFFFCLGCSIMFSEPGLFTDALDHRKTATSPPVGAPARSIHADAVRARFWTARARRLAGGIEPNSDAILRLRDLYRQ